jgi:hypothetical protein
MFVRGPPCPQVDLTKRAALAIIIAGMEVILGIPTIVKSFHSRSRVPECGTVLFPCSETSKLFLLSFSLGPAVLVPIMGFGLVYSVHKYGGCWRYYTLHGG